jgi:hypothetical protein
MPDKCFQGGKKTDSYCIVEPTARSAMDIFAVNDDLDVPVVHNIRNTCSFHD